MRDQASDFQLPTRKATLLILTLSWAIAGGLPTWATDICGNVTCNDTWEFAGSPYVVTCGASVPAGCTLAIDAGVEVRFQPGTGLAVLGTLDVNGAPGNDVTFTSDAVAPAPGDWQGLSFGSSATGIIDSALISYPVDGINGAAGSNVTLNNVGITHGSGSGVYVSGATTTLTNVTTTENTYGVYVVGNGSATLTNVTSRLNDYGLLVYNGDSTVDASGCTFTDNNVNGVYAGSYSYQYAPALTITSSSIHSNLGAHDYYTYAYKNADSTELNATGNWWGTTDDAAIRGRIYDHANTAGSPLVDWCGYLDGPAGLPYAQGGHCTKGPICDETVVWDQTDQPYVLITDVLVCPTGTLQIEAGVEVRALPHTGLGIEVAGQLDVNGTPGNEVSFTSGAASPAAGDWRGLSFSSSATGTIDHAVIGYPVDGVYAADSSYVTLNNVSINDGSANGVYANGASVTADLSGVTTSQCDNGVQANAATANLVGVTATQNGYGVYVHNGAPATLTNVTTTENTYGVYVVGNGSATLTNVTSRLNDYGLLVYNGDSTVDASGCTFTDNNVNGVYAGSYSYQYAPALTITSSSIHSNLGAHDYYTYAYKNADSTVLWAPDNWWGTMDHDEIRERIYDRDETTASPRVWFAPFGGDCGGAIGEDQDGDGLGDLVDNCPLQSNADQADGDFDGMGDACDPEPATAPVADCDGITDTFEGYADSDSDSWGDPCDFQPARDDCHPGAVEICDGRDNDGDGLFAPGELTDADFDGAMACADCDDAEPQVYPCACESCVNLEDDDCDTFVDGSDTDCEVLPYCILVTAAVADPVLGLGKGVCGGAGVSGPFEVISGSVAALQSTGGHVDLGDVSCVDGALAWDRLTIFDARPNPACDGPSTQALFYLAREDGAADFGTSQPGGDPRDSMSPTSVCP